MNELAPWNIPSAARRSPLEDFFTTAVPALLQPAARRTGWQGPRMDIAETEAAYQLAVELPGASKASIKVSLQENTVAIEVEPAAQPEEESLNWLLRERSFGKLARSVTLPEPVDEEASEARYVDGVLYLTLTKSRATRARRLEIA